MLNTFRNAWVSALTAKYIEGRGNTSHEYGIMPASATDEQCAKEAARVVDKILPGLATGATHWDGPCVRAACKAVGLKQGQGRIMQWFAAQNAENPNGWREALARREAAIAMPRFVAA